jgi:hypothetical protein
MITAFIKITTTDNESMYLNINSIESVSIGNDEKAYICTNSDNTYLISIDEYNRILPILNPLTINSDETYEAIRKAINSKGKKIK